MDDLTVLEARVKAIGDQVGAHMRSDLEQIKRIVETDPTQWSANDHRVIRATLSGVVGLIYEGRI